MQVEGGVEGILGNVGGSVKLQTGIRIQCEQAAERWMGWRWQVSCQSLARQSSHSF